MSGIKLGPWGGLLMLFSLSTAEAQSSLSRMRSLEQQITEIRQLQADLAPLLESLEARLGPLEGLKPRLAGLEQLESRLAALEKRADAGAKLAAQVSAMKQIIIAQGVALKHLEHELKFVRPDAADYVAQSATRGSPQPWRATSATSPADTASGPPSRPRLPTPPDTWRRIARESQSWPRN